MNSQFDIFVSYSSDDAALVDGLVRLLGLSGRKVFVDKDSIEPGDLWEQSLREAIFNSQQIVLLWCCHSCKSKWVAAEIQQAVEENKAIIPLLLCSEPVPEPVSKYQWIDLRNIFVHPCKHPEAKVRVETVNPRHIMPPEPGAMGLTYWDTLYSPEEYLFMSVLHDIASLTEVQSMSHETKILCGVVIRALELQSAGNDQLRLGDS